MPFVAWFATCLFVGVWHWGFAKYAFPDNPFRILLAVSALALAVHASAKKSFVIGLLVASVCAALSVLYGYVMADTHYPRISGTTNHPIYFGNFSAMLVVLLISMAALDACLKTTLRLVCMLGSVLAFGAVIASQSRSSFVVLLCLVPLLLMRTTDRFHRNLVRFAYAFVLSCALLVALTPSLQERLRLKESVSDIEMIDSNNYQGSIGSRLAMWQAAWRMFKAHPVVGIGPHKFQSEFIKKMESGEVPRADSEHNQPHNDMLNAAATGGVLKLFAYLFLMVGPFVFFYKRYKVNQADVDRRIAPILGMQVVGAFFLTGLTNSNFDQQIYSTTYAALVCVLAGLSSFEVNAVEPSTPSTPAVPSR